MSVEVNNLALASAIAAHKAAAKYDDAGFDTAEVLETARLYLAFLTGTTALTAPDAQPEFQDAPEATAPEKPSGTPINPSKLPSRTINILAERGIETIEQLNALTNADLKDWRGLGKQSKEALEAVLAEHGMVLGDEDVKRDIGEPQPGDVPKFLRDGDAAAEPEEEDDIFGDSAPSEPAVTREDVDKLFRQVVQAGGMAAAVKLLEPFQTRKLSEVPDEKLAELHKTASAFLAQKKAA